MDATERRLFFRQFRAALTRQPLEPNDPLYVELYDPGYAAIDVMTSEIESAAQACGLLLTGPRGSGKTTELLRFADRLRSIGFDVHYVDIEQYLSAEREVRLSEFLTALAVAVADLTATDDDDRRSKLSQIWDVIKRVRPTGGATVKVPLGTGDSAPTAEFDLGVRLRQDDSFVASLRADIDHEIGVFIPQIHAFLRDCLPARDGLMPVLIVDSIEKIRGDSDVMESVRRLFADRTSALLFPFVHVVYTVPPYLPALEGGIISQFTGPPRPVGITQVSKQGQPAGEGIDRLLEVVAQREPRWAELIDEADLRVLITKSGGHLRVLFLLLEQLLVLAMARQSPLPVPPTLREDAEAQVRVGFDNLTLEDAALLRRLANDHTGFRVGEGEQQQFARLLDASTVLTHLNGKIWYAVHPLALDALG